MPGQRGVRAPVIHVHRYNPVYNCSNMAGDKGHFVLVPFMAQGHMIPMIDLAHLLAHHGTQVTFITTPLNASRIQPEGCENVDKLPSEEALLNFLEGTRLLAKPLELYLRNLKSKPNCIISDALQHWAHEVSQNLQIPRLSFYSVCSFTLLSIHNMHEHNIFTNITDENEKFIVPGLPDKVVISKAQSPGFFVMPEYEKIGKMMREADLAADGTVVNTFEMLEDFYIEEYAKATGKQVWATGPFFLNGENDNDMSVRGDKVSVDARLCLSWLDLMKERSVVYVSFGSLVVMDSEQMMEIGYGLEASGHPFVWVVKDYEYSSEVEEFDKQIGCKGFIIKGWAPQMEILAHTAVGGFMTHCGWNSSLEGLCSGIPLITWPSFGDQFLNEKLITEVIKVGVSVGVKELGAWVKDGTKKTVMANRDTVKIAVKNVMDEGKESAERREKVKELRVKAIEATKVGGSSYENVKDMIHQYVGKS